MELRHLRYFVAVAEAKNFTVAAEQTLHTTQPSLSRQIRDLEEELGARLFERSSRGLELTAAGRTFLDHARAILAQVVIAAEATRRVALPVKPCFTLGFLTGHEVDWLGKAMRVLHDELPNADVMVSSHSSPVLAERIVKGSLDAAFMRREHGVAGIQYQRILSEPLEVFMPSDHPLARHKTVAPKGLAGQQFLNMSSTAPALRRVIDEYLERLGIEVVSAHNVDNLAMAMSLIASTRAVALLPVYARNFATWSVTSRPLQGEPPAIDLVVGYKEANGSEVLKLFLRRLGER